MINFVDFTINSLTMIEILLSIGKLDGDLANKNKIIII